MFEWTNGNGLPLFVFANLNCKSIERDDFNPIGNVDVLFENRTSSH